MHKAHSLETNTLILCFYFCFKGGLVGIHNPITLFAPFCCDSLFYIIVQAPAISCWTAGCFSIGQLHRGLFNQFAAAEHSACFPSFTEMHL